MSSAEFACHIYTLDEEEKEKESQREKWEYYAANICRVLVQLKLPKETVGLDEFFFNYGKKEVAPPTEQQKLLQLKATKNRWALLTGTTLKRLEKGLGPRSRRRKNDNYGDTAKSGRQPVDERVSLHETDAASPESGKRNVRPRSTKRRNVTDS